MTPFIALSWGGGQQSTAIVIASTLGLTINGYEFPRLDVAIFANTGSESAQTYDAVERVTEWARERGTIVVLAEATMIRKAKAKGLNSLGDLLVARMSGDPRSPKSVPQIPAFTLSEYGHRGKLNKDCTYDLKGHGVLDPEVRRRAKAAGKRNDVTQLIGFGYEEVHRIRTNPHAKEGWRYDFPLIDAKMNRHATKALCKEYLCFVPPPSACVFCPFRGVAGWRALRDTAPADYAEVLRVDRAIRDSSRAGVHDACFLSSQRVPVEVAIERDERQGDLFGGSCDDGGCWT